MGARPSGLERTLRPALVALASLVLVGAAFLTIRDDSHASTDTLPSWVPAELGNLAIRPGAPSDVLVDRDFAVGAVRQSIFLGEGPMRQPLSFPALVIGRVARGQLPVSPSGDVTIPKAVNAPAWLVVWRGLPSDSLTRFGAWPDDARVDAVFLVDGVTGDCCWLNLFLAGDSRLG